MSEVMNWDDSKNVDQLSAKEAEARPNCLLVLGMHRSGTSALTRVLNIAGAELPQNLMKPAISNELGHWEPLDIVTYHDRLLSDLGSSWDDWRTLDMSSLTVKRRKEAEKEIREIITADYGDASLFVLKDPRICRFAPFYFDLLNEMGINPRPVLICRNPLEVCESLEHRDGMSRADAVLLWLRHVLDAEKATRGMKRTIFTYHHFLEDWKAVFRQLSKQLGIKNLHTIKEITPQVEEFLSSAHRHHVREVKDVRLDPILRDWAGETYEAILMLARNPNSKKAFAQLDRITEEFDRASPVLHQLYNMVRKELGSAVGDLKSSLSDVDSKITELTIAVSAKDEGVNGLQAVFLEQETKAGDLTSALVKVEDTAGKLTVILAEQDKEVSGFKTLLAEQDNEVSGLKTQLSEQDKGVLDLKAQLSEQDKEVSGLKTQLSAQDKGVLDLKAQLSEQDKEVSGLKTQLAKWNKEVSGFKIQLLEAENLVSEFSATLKEQEKKVPELSALLLQEQQIHKETKAAMTREKQILSVQLQEKAALLVAKQGRVHELEKQLSVSRPELQRTQAELTYAEDWNKAYLDSNSWRVTAPLRNLKRRFVLGNIQRNEYGYDGSSGALSYDDHIQQNGSFKSLKIKKYWVSGKTTSGKRNILVVGHVVGANLFGSENSLIGIISSIDKSKYAVHAVFPQENKKYFEKLKPHVESIVSFPYSWRSASGPKREEVIMFERLITENNIDVVHSNTIALQVPLVAARNVGVPSIIHCREIISIDPDLCVAFGMAPDTIIKQVQEEADYCIANSEITKKTLRFSKTCFRIYNEVDTTELDIDNSFNPNRIYVGLISSNIPKKGIDEFVALARLAEGQLPNLVFRVIGPKNEYVRTLEKKAGELPGNLEFIGYQEGPLEAISKTNIVMSMSTFAESFGRTIAEAMAARRPVIAYAWGAIPELMTHGEEGFLIPYLDFKQALPHLELLSKNPKKIKEMGDKGRVQATTCFSRHVFKQHLNAAYDDILKGWAEENNTTHNIQALPASAPQSGPRVSVVIPNYNYENYLEKRINSIIDQTYPPHEIIFLDDCSTDNSMEMARPLLEHSGIPFKIIPNTTNQGVYRQWLRGISEATGNWIWFAEADDVAEPDFLSSLTDKASDGVNLVYCQSKRIDGDGIITAANNLGHTNDIDTKRWLNDYVEIGVREVVDVLAYRNSIPNASAALLRKSAIDGIEEQLLKHRYCGDWLLYAHMLRYGKIAFVSRSLNHFRRHEKSVTRMQSQTLAYLNELADLRQFIAQNFPILPRHMERLNWFLDRDYKIKNIARNSLCAEIVPTLKAAEADAQNRKRFLFITTNDGSYFGGSEILWRETALKLRAEGHDVFVLIKEWDPTPDFFPEFEGAGIKLFFKDEQPFEDILAVTPDMVVVSIGDQDEGIEYYPALTRCHLPYVIINQLTKEKRFWPLRKLKTEEVKKGYRNAGRVFFTCHNNHRVMQDRLGCKIKNAEIHTNPYHIDRDLVPPYPDTKHGLQIAMPAKILFIHKGHDLLAEVVGAEHWKARDITLNFYGIGSDLENLQELAREKGISCFKFHGRVSDISDIWKHNHAFVLPSRMEGLPIMLVSGMLSARVPIVTDIGGHAEVVNDGHSGFIAKDPTVKALDHAMERAYSARHDWREIGQKARKDILEYLPQDPVEDFVAKLHNVMRES